MQMDYFTPGKSSRERSYNVKSRHARTASDTAPGSIPKPVCGLWFEESSVKSCQIPRRRTHGSSAQVNRVFPDSNSTDVINRTGSSKQEGRDRIHRGRTAISTLPSMMKFTRKSYDTLDVADDKCYDKHIKASAEVIAQQITLIELKYFKAIRPEEFLSLNWNGKDKMRCAPNIVISTRWFNQITFWVQKDVLNESNLSKRTCIVSHFIRIAKKLVDMNNFCSAMAIVCSLNMQCVYRLTATWANLSSRDRATLRKLNDLFTQEQNYFSLRTAIDNARLPCIPYLGIYLSDLTYMDVAASSVMNPSGTSWDAEGKSNRINNLLQTITNFQKSDYPFTRNDFISTYLESQCYIEELQRIVEDANYKLSLKIEPLPVTTSTATGALTSSQSALHLNKSGHSTWACASSQCMQLLTPVQVHGNSSKSPGGLTRFNSLTESIEDKALGSATSSADPVSSSAMASNEQQYTRSNSARSHKLAPPIWDVLFPPALIPPPPASSSLVRKVSQEVIVGHPNSSTYGTCRPMHRRLGSWGGLVDQPVTNNNPSSNQQEMTRLCLPIGSKAKRSNRPPPFSDKLRMSQSQTDLFLNSASSTASNFGSQLTSWPSKEKIVTNPKESPSRTITNTIDNRLMADAKSCNKWRPNSTITTTTTMAVGDLPKSNESTSPLLPNCRGSGDQLSDPFNASSSSSEVMWPNLFQSPSALEQQSPCGLCQSPLSYSDNEHTPIKRDRTQHAQHYANLELGPIKRREAHAYATPVAKLCNNNNSLAPPNNIGLLKQILLILMNKYCFCCSNTDLLSHLGFIALEAVQSIRRCVDKSVDTFYPINDNVGGHHTNPYGTINNLLKNSLIIGAVHHDGIDADLFSGRRVPHNDRSNAFGHSDSTESQDGLHVLSESPVWYCNSSLTNYDAALNLLTGHTTYNQIFTNIVTSLLPSAIVPDNGGSSRAVSTTAETCDKCDPQSDESCAIPDDDDADDVNPTHRRQNFVKYKSEDRLSVHSSPEQGTEESGVHTPPVFPTHTSLVGSHMDTHYSDLPVNSHRDPVRPIMAGSPPQMKLYQHHTLPPLPSLTSSKQKRRKQGFSLPHTPFKSFISNLLPTTNHNNSDHIIPNKQARKLRWAVLVIAYCKSGGHSSSSSSPLPNIYLILFKLHKTQKSKTFKSKTTGSQSALHNPHQHDNRRMSSSNFDRNEVHYLPQMFSPTGCHVIPVLDARFTSNFHSINNHQPVDREEDSSTPPVLILESSGSGKRNKVHCLSVYTIVKKHIDVLDLFVNDANDSRTTLDECSHRSSMSGQKSNSRRKSQNYRSKQNLPGRLAFRFSQSVIQKLGFPMNSKISNRADSDNDDDNAEATDNASTALTQSGTLYSPPKISIIPLLTLFPELINRISFVGGW